MRKAIQRKTNIINKGLDENNINLSANLTFLNSCSSSVSDNTSKVAESYLPNLPELTLNEKINNLLTSKSKETAQKKSLQNIKHRSFKKIVKISVPEMNQNPPYFRTHTTVESIYFFLASFIFSSFLTMGVDYITFISCAFLHITAGFYDPAFLNTVFLAIGQIFDFILILVEKSPHCTFVFPSWIPKVRTRPRKMFSNLYKLNNYELYSNISMLSYTAFHKIFDISQPSQTRPEQFEPIMVTVKNNVILDNLGNKFRENHGTLEYVSPGPLGRSFSDYGPNKKIKEKLRHPKNVSYKLTNDINNKTSLFLDQKKDLTYNKNYVLKDMCDTKHIENMKNG